MAPMFPRRNSLRGTCTWSSMSTCRPIGTIRCENRLLENNREQESTSSSVLTSYVFTVTDVKLPSMKIPRKLLDAVSLDLIDVPIELDYRTETVLRKAYVLADDWKIDSPELVRQLMPD